MSDYRINYTIERRKDDESDFAEIGFGSSGNWNDVDSALYAVQSDVQNQSWETVDGMPEPGDA